MKFGSYFNSFLLVVFSACAVTANTYAVQHIDTSGDTVVCFAKNQNPLSKFIKPLFDQVAMHYKLYGINFIYADITKDFAYFENKFHLFTVPTVIYFKNGYEVYRHEITNQTMSQDKKNNIIIVDMMKKHVERIYFV